MAEPVSAATPALFPLFEGGPFSRFLAPLGLTGTEQRDVRRRIVAAVLLTWVPMAVLAALQGQAISADWHRSMLLDPAMYARYLVALPLLIAAAPGLQRSLHMVVPHFLEADLVREPERGVFLASISTLLRWRDSLVAAGVLILLAVGNALSFSAGMSANFPGSWRFMGVESARLSLAGWWLVGVAQPVYILVVLQFLYRLGLWWRFLWLASRLHLALDAAHPDGAGGLAFLTMPFRAFWLPLFAIAATAAGTLANVILWTGAPIMSFQTAIGTCVAGLVALVVAPLLFFSGQLRAERNRGILRYGASAGRQLRVFGERWLEADPPKPGEMLSAPDFAAVSGFGQTAAAVGGMRKMVFGPRQLVPLIVAALLPFLPVAAMQVPIKEILTQVWKLIA